MTLTIATDISFVLSGGSTNLNPNNSLGGMPSSAPIVDSTMNNLFDDVSALESQTDFVDYRCFYIFNDGTTAVYDADAMAWYSQEGDAGRLIELMMANQTSLLRAMLEPTADMLLAGVETDGDAETYQENYTEIWQAMLRAFGNGIGVKL